MAVVAKAFSDKGGSLVKDVAGSLCLDWIREAETSRSEVVVAAGLEEGDVAGVGC